MILRSFYKFLLYRTADMFIILLETTKTSNRLEMEV